jgi:hypothetical protein
MDAALTPSPTGNAGAVSAQRTQTNIYPEETSLQPEIRSSESIQQQTSSLPVVRTSTSPQKVMPEDLIQTEIGPLPGDLWRVLNQSPPQEPANQRNSGRGQAGKRENSSTLEMPAGPPPHSQDIKLEPGTPQVARVRWLRQGTTATPQIHTQPSSLRHRNSGTMPNIQRTLDAEQPQPDVSTPAGSPGEANAEGAQLSDRELDALARQVYAEIRLKLAIERERIRRR